MEPVASPPKNPSSTPENPPKNVSNTPEAPPKNVSNTPEAPPKNVSNKPETLPPKNSSDAPEAPKNASSAAESPRPKNASKAPKKNVRTTHVCKGILLLFVLLIYHFLQFFMTMSMGIGVGILAAVIHYNFWYFQLDPFWQTYITLISVFLVSELYFRMMSNTKINNWMNKTQSHYRITLYFIPRGLYFVLYVVTIISLFIQYKSVHEEMYEVRNVTYANANDSSATAISYVTPKSPLSLELDDDRYFRTILFVISLSYMMYVLVKESDWMTHRLKVMATGQDDPIAKGSIGSVLVLTGAHAILTLIYSLPLVGFIFIFKTFIASWEVTYFIICPLAAMIGVFVSFLERQSLFPQTPMKPPNYAYENHLRIRVSFLHYWLIPLAAGRYFNRTKATVLNATDGDFLVFTMEVAIGVLQASKVISNDIYLNWFAVKSTIGEPQEEGVQFPELLEVNSTEFEEEEEEYEYAQFYTVMSTDEVYPIGPTSTDQFDQSISYTAVPFPEPKSSIVSGINIDEEATSVHSLMKRIV